MAIKTGTLEYTSFLLSIKNQGFRASFWPKETWKEIITYGIQRCRSYYDKIR